MENKGFFERFNGHLSTITRHKMEVMKLCFRCGLYKQGLLHDLSKYSPVEFWSGVKYYQGFRSPIDAEKEAVGYSLGWLHHSGRNKHHWEYWIDKDYPNVQLIVRKMPFNYVLEAVCDKIAASKIYKKDKYTDASAYEFLKNGRDRIFMGEENARRHFILLEYLKDNGEKKALAYYKSLYKQWKKDHSFDI
ncbi:MAG: catalase [Erysipelotrichaceae bacterium]|nr:catalase [Erysipelotrichaceae bacterium]